MSLYAVYDKATLHVVKAGIASPDDCEAQNDDPAAHAVVSADSAEEMDALKASLGLIG